MNTLVFHWKNVDFAIWLFSLHLGFIRARYRWWSLLTRQHPWAEKTSTSDIGGRWMLGCGEGESSARCSAGDAFLFLFSFSFIYFFLRWPEVSLFGFEFRLLPPPPESCDNTPSLHSTWDRTQGLVQARQVLHHLCHPPQSCSLSPGLTTLD